MEIKITQKEINNIVWKACEFYTHGEVSTLIAKLTKSKPGARICDPTCGSGSLLIKAGREVGSDNFSLYGQEANGSTWALAVMNMFLHGFDNATIRWGDTINNPKLKEGDALMKFDTVVANPPFSLDKWGAENAASDKYNRFWRGIPAAILIFNRGKAQNKNVLFIDSSKSFEAGKNQNRLRPSDIEHIVDTYNKFNKGELLPGVVEDKYSCVATFGEIEENDFNLNIPRYVDTFEEEPEVDIAAVQIEVIKLEEELKAVQEEMAKYFKELGV